MRMAPVLFVAVAFTACNGSSGDSKETVQTQPASETSQPAAIATTSAQATTTMAPSVTTTAEPPTTTTIDPVVALLGNCYMAAVDTELVAYVDNIAGQLTIPAGVADKLYATAQSCNLLGDELLVRGQLEASTPITNVATTADLYAQCLVVSEYHCGVLRIQYITAVNAIGECTLAPSVFDRVIGACKTVLESLAATPDTAPVDPAATTTTMPATPAVTADITTAAGILESFAVAGLPVGERVVYTEETDPNESLGRPGNYIGKAAWLDTRIGDCVSEEIGWDCGGDVEVFDNTDNRDKRFEYLGTFASGFPGGYYMWKVENAIIRVGFALTPTQAADYERVLTVLYGNVESFEG